jgi:hypothetical protein
MFFILSHRRPGFKFEDFNGIPMKFRICACLFWGLLLIPLLAMTATAQQSCESLASIKIPNVTVTSAKSLDKGRELPVQEGFISTKPDSKRADPIIEFDPESFWRGGPAVRRGAELRGLKPADGGRGSGKSPYHRRVQALLG